MFVFQSFKRIRVEQIIGLFSLLFKKADYLLKPIHGLKQINQTLLHL